MNTKKKGLIVGFIILAVVSIAILFTLPLSPKREIVGMWECRQWDEFDGVVVDRRDECEKTRLEFYDDGILIIYHTDRRPVTGRYEFISKEAIELRSSSLIFDGIFDIGFGTNNELTMGERGKYGLSSWNRINSKFNFSFLDF